jgi:hypothetical protein
MNSKKRSPSPWDDPAAAKWLGGFDNWHQVTRLIHGTLKLDAKKNSHEIRAAASMVIMFCRDNCWPGSSPTELDDVCELAAKQLSTIKHFYEAKARSDHSLRSNPKYRILLDSLGQEIRILEARITDPKPAMPNNPPLTWGNFWTNDE